MNKTEKISLSVVVTVYSETLAIIETVERLVKNDRGYIKEIILLVSPKASQETKDICSKLAKKYLNLKIHIQKNNPGVGWALREGMEVATGNYVTIMSSDLETEPEAVDRMVKKIEETGADMVIGNRWLRGGGFVNYDPYKLILNWIFQQFFKILFWTKIGDLTYGFKTTKKSVIENINWESTLHEIFIETTVKVLKKGYKVEQIPTVWIGRREGVSQNNFLRNFRYVKLAFKVLFGLS